MTIQSKPPVTGSSHPLPFERLAPLEFERLCLWLVQREGFTRAEHLGEAGSEGGRDVVAWMDGRRFVFQCKRVQAFAAAQAKKEIEKLRKLPVGEQPHELVFVVTRAVSADARREICTAWGDKETCHFWAGSELDERVKRYPGLVREFFQLPASASWFKWGLSLSLLGVLLTLAAWLWPRSPESRPIPSKPASYAVRVQVLDPQGQPVDGATVRVSVGNETKRVPDGGWEIEIPEANVPAGGRISLWADHEAWGGSRIDLRLGEDPNPRAEIRLKEPETWIRGRALDGSDRALPGARITRQDGMPGSAVTDEEGRFALKLALPRDTRVRLQAERSGSLHGDNFCYAGRDSCVIVMEEQ
jgi:hypothetical protein